MEHFSKHPHDNFYIVSIFVWTVLIINFFHVGSGGLIFCQTSPAISHGTSLLLVQLFFFGSTDVPRTQRVQKIAQVVRNGSHRLDLTVLTVLGMERYGTVWGGMGRYGEVWVVYRERVWVG